VQPLLQIDLELCRGLVASSGGWDTCRCTTLISDGLLPVQASRRSALGLLAAGAALVTRVDPSQAAYGESANIFGKTTNKAGAHACTTGRCAVHQLNEALAPCSHAEQ
jgi:hypothetical protein